MSLQARRDQVPAAGPFAELVRSSIEVRLGAVRTERTGAHGEGNRCGCIRAEPRAGEIDPDRGPVGGHLEAHPA